MKLWMYMDNLDIADPFEARIGSSRFRRGELPWPDLLIQPPAEPLGIWKHASVTYQLDDVPCAVQHGRAVPANFKVRLHSVAKFSRDLAAKIVRFLARLRHN